MFQSIGPMELMTIGIVALIVFGPHRLPEMARKVGGYVRELRAAAADIRKGLDAEVQALKEPIDAVKADLTKPVSEVKETLAETADAVKKSTESTTAELNKVTDDLKTSGPVQWIGAEPKTGVSPTESWDGMNDPVPDAVADLPTEYVEPSGESESDDTEADRDSA